MALPGDSNVATLCEKIMNSNEEEVDSDQSSWVRRSTRPVQPTSPNAAANTNNEEDAKTAGEVKPRAKKKSNGRRKNLPPNKQVEATYTNPTTAAAATATTATRAAANNDEDAKPVVKDNPKPTKKARGRRKKQPRDTVQLFAFDDLPAAGVDSAGRDGGRPKRKLKAVARFDSQSYGARSKRARCVAGHGFNCPRCAHACSYDSKACALCGLTCSYEAGVGVVVLRERDDVGARPRKRGKAAVGAGDDAVAEKGGPKKEAKARRKGRKKLVGRGGRAKKNAKQPALKSRSSASAAASASSASAAAKSAFAAAMWAQSSADASAAAKSAFAAADSTPAPLPPARPVARKRLKKKKVDAAGDNDDDGGGGSPCKGAGDGGKGCPKKIDASVASDDGDDSNRCVGMGGQGKHLPPPRDGAESPSLAEVVGQGKRLLPSPPPQGRAKSPSHAATAGQGKRLLPPPPRDGAKSPSLAGMGSQGKRLLQPPRDDAGSPSRAATEGQGKRLLPPPPLRDDAESPSLVGMESQGKRLLPPQDADVASTGSSAPNQRPSYATFRGSHATGWKTFGKSVGKSLENVPEDPEDDVRAGDATGDAGPSKRPAPPQDADVAGTSGCTTKQCLSRAVFGGSHAAGGKTFGQSVGKSLASVPGDDSARTEDARTTGGGGRLLRPVVALHERRPFVIREYPSLDDARKDLGTYAGIVRERSNYNREHCRRKKMNKGKFVHYDFRDAGDVRTARRWQRELLAAKHEDFLECETLTEARGHPSWPVRMADAYHRMRMGRRILKFMRPLAKGRSCTLPPVQGRGKCVRAIANHVSFAENLANHIPDERKPVPKVMDVAEEDDEDEDEDDCEVAKDVIVTAIRDRLQTFTGSHHQLSEHMGRLHDSASLPDFGSFGRTESEEEHDMVNLLNEDFPPEDHPPECFASKRRLSNDVSNQNLDAKIQETNQSLHAVTEEKNTLEGKLKDLQTKYNLLFTNSIKTEEELRETISTLIGTAPESRKSESSSNNQTSDLEEKLSVVSSERDDLAKKVGDVASMELERDELAQRLEEANAKLQVWENIEKQIDVKNSKDVEEKTLTTAGEKASALEELGFAASDLAAARGKTDTQMIKISRLKSSKQRDSVNSRVSELLAGNNGNTNGFLSSLMSERNALAVSVEESKEMITRLETEKLAALAKSASLEDTVEELLGRIESLSVELHASKHANGTNFINESDWSDHKKPADESMQSDFSDREAAQNSTIANLENIIKQQSDEVKALSENVATSNTHVTELTVQIFKLTSERDDLATKVGEVTGEVSNLQSAIETIQAERDTARAKVQRLQSGNAHTEKIMSALNSEKAILISKIEECIARLYSEKEESPPNPNGKSLSPTNGRHRSRWDNGAASPMEKLEKQLRDRSAEVSKLTKDKEKLEAYTKQTLQIFQQKYFATTRDYKAKLKNMTEKIHALETELANSKADAQNDPLISSAIYLGRSDPTSDTTHDTATADGSSDIAERKAPADIDER